MIRIFIAYSSKDLAFKEEIRKRLGPLKRAGKVDIWDNYDIEAGKDWDVEVREKLSNSDLILLLLSPDALDSEYFYEVEAPIALARHQAGEAIAVGVLLRPCSFRHTPFEFGKYELLPKKGYPIVDKQWHNSDEAYLSISEAVDVLVEKIERKREGGKPIAPQPEKKVAKPKREVLAAKTPAIKPTEKKVPAKALKQAKQSDEISRLMQRKSEIQEARRILEAKLITIEALKPGSQGAVKPLFEIILFDAGSNKISVVKEVKDLLQLPLANAKNLVESPPFLLKGGVNKAEAQRIKSLFEAMGAVVEVLPEHLDQYFTSPKNAQVIRDIPESPEMVFVEGGTFQMGSNEYDSEKPIHPVSVPSFWMGKFPVTFEEYDAFCSQTGKGKPSDQGWGRGLRPVINVSWEDAQEYCKWLSSKTGARYRLPSEAEWEFAAQGGMLSKGFKFSGDNLLDEVGWYSANSGNKAHPVGEKKANELGLHDMSGNVWEWCQDAWHGNYDGAPADGSAWMAGGDDTSAVLRGGSWSYNDDNCRAAFRYWNYRNFWFNFIGWRVARAAGGE